MRIITGNVLTILFWVDMDKLILHKSVDVQVHVWGTYTELKDVILLMKPDSSYGIVIRINDAGEEEGIQVKNITIKPNVFVSDLAEMEILSADDVNFIRRFAMVVAGYEVKS